MRNNLNEQESYDMSLWDKLKSFAGFSNDDYDEEYDNDESYHKPKFQMRIPTSNIVCVWRNISSVDDTQEIGELLKNGQPQIINFENTDDEGAITRNIDFLSGVVFALGGSILKIGNRIWLCMPSNFKTEECGESEKKKIWGSRS